MTEMSQSQRSARSACESCSDSRSVVIFAPIRLPSDMALPFPRVAGSPRCGATPAKRHRGWKRTTPRCGLAAASERPAFGSAWAAAKPAETGMLFVVASAANRDREDRILEGSRRWRTPAERHRPGRDRLSSPAPRSCWWSREAPPRRRAQAPCPRPRSPESSRATRSASSKGPASTPRSSTTTARRSGAATSSISSPSPARCRPSTPRSSC